jgi:import inner membrane translocase subunit TIM50
VDEIVEPKDGKYTLPSLDIDPEIALPEPSKESQGGEGAGGKKRTGAGRKEYVSSIERQRKMWARMGMGAAALGALGAAYYASQGEVRLLCQGI